LELEKTKRVTKASLKEINEDIKSNEELDYKTRDYVRFFSILFFFVWIISLLLIVVKFIFSLIIPASVPIIPSIKRPPFDVW